MRRPTRRPIGRPIGRPIRCPGHLAAGVWPSSGGLRRHDRYNRGMCGRFTLRARLNDLARQFGFDAASVSAEFPRYNVAPTQQVLAIRRREEDATPRAAWLRWGLVPG